MIQGLMNLSGFGDDWESIGEKNLRPKILIITGGGDDCMKKW